MPLKYSNARRSERSTPSPSAYMRPSFHCAAIRPCSAAYSSETSAFSFCPSRSARAPDRNASNGVMGIEGAANAVGGGTGRSSEGAGAGEAIDGTGAVGRGRLAFGIAVGTTPPARGIDPGGRGTSTIRLFTEAGVIPAGGVAGVTRSVGGRVVPSNPNAGANPDISPSAAAIRMRSRVRIADLLGFAARMGDGAVHGRSNLLGVFPQITGGEIGLARLPALLAVGKLGVGQRDIDRAVDGVDGDHVAVLE